MQAKITHYHDWSNHCAYTLYLHNHEDKEWQDIADETVKRLQEYKWDDTKPFMYNYNKEFNFIVEVAVEYGWKVIEVGIDEERAGQLITFEK